MKKLTLSLFFLMFIVTVTAQSLYVEAGKTISSFDYKDSAGNRLDNLQSKTYNSMALGYRHNLLIEKLHGAVGFNYTELGALGSDERYGNYMEWNLNYIQFVTSLDYELLALQKFKVYAKGATAISFLVQGTQVINNSVFDLKNNDSYNQLLFDYKLGAGISYPISEDLSFYAQYIYSKSLPIKEGTSNPSSHEELRIIGNNVSFGVLINLNKKTSKELIK